MQGLAVLLAKNMCDNRMKEIEPFYENRNYRGLAMYLLEKNYNTLRNQQLINRLKESPYDEFHRQPVWEYFRTILDYSQLNEIESMEICKMFSNNMNLINKLIWKDKLTFTEDLGDLFLANDPMIAHNIYRKANVLSKVNLSYVVVGMYNKLVNPDWVQIITYIIDLYPDKLETVLKYMLTIKGTYDPINIANVLNEKPNYNFILFVFIKNYLKDNSIKDSQLQTILFESAIKYSSETIMNLIKQNKYTYYDHQRIGSLLEEKNWFMHALLIYDDLPSIKRCIYHTDQIPQDFLIEYFDKLNSEWSFECLIEIFNQNLDNDKTFINIVQIYSKKIGASKINELLKETLLLDQIREILSKIVVSCDDPEMNFYYIVLLIQYEDYDEVNRICKHSINLEPKLVYGYLKQQNIPSLYRAIIALAFRFQLIEDATRFFYENNCLNLIISMAQECNPLHKNGEKILSTLLKLDAPKNFIERLVVILLKSTMINIIFQLCVKFDYIDCLDGVVKMFIEFNTTEKEKHNIIVLYSALLDRDAVKILREDNYYDPKFVGDFLSNRNPYLASLSYFKGMLDQEFINITNKYKFFSIQACYCITRQNQNLWNLALSSSNKNISFLVNAIISQVEKIKNPDSAFMIVKAFIDAKIQPQLLELLDKLIFHTYLFKNNTYMQNLLINTSIMVDPSRVMSYIYLLNNYIPDQIGDQLIKAKLYDEAITMYNKFGQHQKASNIIFNYKTEPTFESFHNFEIQLNNLNIENQILQKFIDVFDNKNLNAVQSIELCQHILSKNREKLELCSQKNKILNVKNSSIQFSNEIDTTSNQVKIIDINNMTKMELIGRGGASEVFKYSKVKYYALKKLFINVEQSKSIFDECKQFMNEYMLIKSIKSPYVIKTHGFYIGEENKPPSILMSLCPSSLDKQIKALSRYEKVVILQDICNGMITIHLMGIIHCDLKPNNILLNKNNRVKITDFGSAKTLQDLTLTSNDIEGTLKYMAPERFKKKKFNEKVDVYSFGIILYFIWTGGETPDLPLSDVVNGIIPKIPDNVDDFYKDLILKCISFDPNERPSFQNILKSINKHEIDIKAKI